MFRLLLCLILGFTALSACSHTPHPLSDIEQQRLTQPATGDLIYTGEVWLPNAAKPNFQYTRTVSSQEDRWMSTHLTYDTQTQQVLVRQEATHTSQYQLLNFKQIHKQTGIISAVRVQPDGSLSFTRNDLDEHTVEPSQTEPVVVGPTLFGYILHHWDHLLAGNTHTIRFAVPERAQSYLFQIRVKQHTKDRITFSMIAEDFLVSLVTNPMYMDFHPSTHQIMRYQGAIPPLDEDLSSLEGTVRYTPKTPLR